MENLHRTERKGIQSLRLFLFRHCSSDLIRYEAFFSQRTLNRLDIVKYVGCNAFRPFQRNDPRQTAKKNSPEYTFVAELRAKIDLGMRQASSSFLHLSAYQKPRSLHRPRIEQTNHVSRASVGFRWSNQSFRRRRHSLFDNRQKNKLVVVIVPWLDSMKRPTMIRERRGNIE